MLTALEESCFWEMLWMAVGDWSQAEIVLVIDGFTVFLSRSFIVSRWFISFINQFSIIQ